VRWRLLLRPGVQLRRWLLRHAVPLRPIATLGAPPAANPAGGAPARSRKGDRVASAETIAVLVENHRRFLAFLERRVGSRDVAEDILQDAFVRGLARADQLRDQESIVAWFYRSLRNALVDHWRRVGAERRVFEDGAEVADGEEPAVDAELMNAVCTCATSLLDTLKPEYAHALRQVDLGGMSVKTFARNGGLTANNASVRLFRARNALKREVERTCGTCATHGCLDCSCGAPAR
jgi:RNA polymerase sigma factor (sigma-70 family)